MKPQTVLTHLMIAVLAMSLGMGQQSPATIDFGSVEGTVLDDNGQPVEDAIVSIQPEDVQMTGKLPSGRSRAGGKFSIDGVPAGKSFIFAGKPRDGYPDTQFAVFTAKEFVLSSIVVAKGKTTSNVIVRLPSKGGIIAGKIIDAHTGAPVLTARIHLFQAGDPERDISTSPNPQGTFEFAVPSVAYKIEVAAPHYKPWRLGQDGETHNEDSMVVVRGAVRNLIIKLERTASNPQ